MGYERTKDKVMSIGIHWERIMEIIFISKN